MSTAIAIQVSVTQLVVGIVAGVMIEAIIPTPLASSSVGATVFEALVQTAVNGVFLSSIGVEMSKGDPTFGAAMFWGLAAAQPNYSKRLAVLAETATQQVNRLGLQMAPRPPAEELPKKD